MNNGIQTFWRAEVYTEQEQTVGISLTRKLFAGIYSTHKAAEQAAERLCEQVSGFGFFVHAIRPD